MELKAGTRLKSAVCATEAIVVKASGDDVDVTCGGVSMVAAGTEGSGDAVADLMGGSAMGKRYVDAEETVELLCTKPGEGSIGIGSTALELKEAKALPASD